MRIKINNNWLTITRQMANELADCIKNPPFNWKFWQCGAYIQNGKLKTYAAYHGQGLDECVYNETYDYIWTFDNEESFLMTKKEIEDYIYQAIKEWLQDIQNQEYLKWRYKKMRKEITYKELFDNYIDLENTQMIDLLKLDIQDQKAAEEDIIFISEVLENEITTDSEGNIYPHIKNKTYSLSDSTNSFTIGYVYQK